MLSGAPNFSTFEFPDFVDIVDIMWVDRLDSPNRRHMLESGIFKIMDIEEGTGDRRLFDEVDREEYASRVVEGGTASEVRAQQGYSKYMFSGTVGKDVVTTYQFRTKHKFSETIRKVQDVMDLPLNRTNLDLSHRLTFATATSYTNQDGEVVDVTLGDGLALAASAHTVRGSATTYRNRLQNNPRISRGGLDAMQRMAKENSINIFGQKIADPSLDILWTTDDAEDMNIATEYLVSVGSPSYDNANVKNVYQGKYRHEYLPLVPTDANGSVDNTKRHYWGLCSSRDFQAYLGFWRRPTLIGPFEMEDGSENVRTGARADYGIVIVVARGFFMSTGDGQA
jgi:hypothetical protein